MSRYHDIRDGQPRVRERFPQLAVLFDGLDECSDAQYRAATVHHDAGVESGRRLYASDMVMISLVARSFEIIDAFIEGVDRWNISVGSVMIRLQLDNVLRAHLLATSPEPGAILKHMLSEQPFRRHVLPPSQRDLLPPEYRRGARATDSNMRALAALAHPWVDEYYDIASKAVHHSTAHLMTTWKVTSSENPGTISGRIPADIEQFEVAELMGLLGAMLQSSECLQDYAQDWAERKSKGLDGGDEIGAA